MHVVLLLSLDPIDYHGVRVCRCNNFSEKAYTYNRNPTSTDVSFHKKLDDTDLSACRVCRSENLSIMYHLCNHASVCVRVRASACLCGGRGVCVCIFSTHIGNVDISFRSS